MFQTLQTRDGLLRDEPELRFGTPQDEARGRRIDQLEAELKEVRAFVKELRDATIGSGTPSIHTRVRRPWPRSPSPSGSRA